MGLGETVTKARHALFQSTHPVWDGTIYVDFSLHLSRYFNPPIPCGMGPEDCLDDAAAELFQSTHPVWDGTPREVRLYQRHRISIHPSRVGWDKRLFYIDYKLFNFNPPIPCGMGRLSYNVTMTYREFQSTHPVWDGTWDLVGGDR